MLTECNRFLRHHLKRYNPDRSWLVLEAGGGSFSHFLLPDNSQLISLDIDHGQLKRNETADIRIQGDVHALPVKANSVDMIICFNVIEHLEDPESCLKQLNYCLKKGGLLVLGCPSRNSLKGIITRLTPIGFHRWYYKYVVGKQDRGDGHYDAFPTPFKTIVAPRRLETWCQQHAMDILFFEKYDGAKTYQIIVGSPLKRLLSLPYYLATYVLYLLSLGRWQADLSDLLLVAEKE